ncbi:phage head closure protein [Sulfitobacter sp.]|uniref:phage head closure protein n=1 Tax=Sulfitobacter sp. TaxID=1903071 RepID=UPI0030023667
MKMGAGALRHQVKFRRRGSQVDDLGNPVGQFEDLFTVWGNVRETTGKERVAAGSVENLRTATIRIRKSPQTSGITEADQAVTRNEEWNILGIANVGHDDAMLDMLVQAGGAQ